MALSRLLEYLDANRVKYSTLKHSAAYTAQQIAQEAHIPGKEMAKTVMVKLDGKFAMAVVPASCRVDLNKLARVTHTHLAELAAESEFAKLFPGCEVGAMPPFGNLWKLPVYVSDTLEEDPMISFNAGTHSEIVTLAFSDFKKLVEPKILAFSVPT